MQPKRGQHMSYSRVVLNRADQDENETRNSMGSNQSNSDFLDIKIQLKTMQEQIQSIARLMQIPPQVRQGIWASQT